tara:strand:+ start:10 stop:240 length:231 start_codon:yes stop_codon:yes gene_type:complete
MITIKELSIDAGSAEKIKALLKKHEPKIWNVLKTELQRAFSLTSVVKSFYCQHKDKNNCIEQCSVCAFRQANTNVQ